MKRPGSRQRTGSSHSIHRPPREARAIKPWRNAHQVYSEALAKKATLRRSVAEASIGIMSGKPWCSTIHDGSYRNWHAMRRDWHVEIDDEHPSPCDREVCPCLNEDGHRPIRRCPSSTQSAEIVTGETIAPSETLVASLITTRYLLSPLHAYLNG